MSEASNEFDPGVLGALTLEQKEVFDLLSRGVMRYEIGRRRHARTEEIFDVIDSVNEQLETPDSAAATYRLLKEGVITPAADEVAAAREKVTLLSEEQTDVLRAMMSGGRYTEAGELLGTDSEEVRQAMDEIASKIHSRSPEQTVRLAYAAGLDELPAETDPVQEEPAIESESEPEPELPERAAAQVRSNVLEFVNWMYPKKNLEPAELDDTQLIALADTIKVKAREIAAGMPTPKLRRQVKPAIDYIDMWLAGQSIAGIARQVGKNDGTIRLSLMGFAEKVGAKLSSDELF